MLHDVPPDTSLERYISITLIFLFLIFQQFQHLVSHMIISSSRGKCFFGVLSNCLCAYLFSKTRNYSRARKCWFWSLCFQCLIHSGISINVRWVNEYVEWSQISQIKKWIKKHTELKLGNLRARMIPLEKERKCPIRYIFNSSDTFWSYRAPLDLSLCKYFTYIIIFP